jgi:hypothetical protein
MEENDLPSSNAPHFYCFRFQLSKRHGQPPVACLLLRSLVI